MVKRSKKLRRDGSFNEKLKVVALYLLMLSAMNLLFLHYLHSVMKNGDSFWMFSTDILSDWDPTEYAVNLTVMPKKLITVIGKESSGTTFVAKTLAEALQLPGRQQKYRDGYFHHERRKFDENPIQVQHVSLPQGAWCVQNHSHHIVDIILPPQCLSDKHKYFPSEDNPRIKQQCENLLTNMKLTEGQTKLHGPWFMRKSWKNNLYFTSIRYPGRNFTQTFHAKHSAYYASEKRHHDFPKDAQRGDVWSFQKKLERQEKIRKMYKRQSHLRHLRKTNHEVDIEEWTRNVKNGIPLSKLTTENLVKYPARFFLNITAQKLWYDRQGTEQVVVIVVRDEEMSYASRIRKHCQEIDLAKEEEQIATGILNDAIRTFLLEDQSSIQSGFNGRWYAKNVSELLEQYLLWDPKVVLESLDKSKKRVDILHSSMIPFKNNVVLVSYEAMMKHQQSYVQKLYTVLGIESDHSPLFKDGNDKYKGLRKANNGYESMAEYAKHHKKQIVEGSLDDESDSNDDPFKVQLDFDGTRIKLPISLGLIAAICLTGVGCTIGFWLLVIRLFFFGKRKRSTSCLRRCS
jgi:hypothetical protein